MATFNIKSSNFVLGEFLNGKLLDGVADSVRLKLYQKNSAAKSENDILVAETSSMTYTSQGTEDLVPAHFSKYAIGLYDTESEKMDIYAADSFLLKPKLDRTESSHKKEDKQTSYTHQKDLLIEAFGSRKGKRAVAARQQNKVESDILEARVNNVASTADIAAVEKPTDPSQDASQYSLLPPFNREADTPSAVYDIYAIVPESEREALQTPAQELASAYRATFESWEKEERFGQEVMKLLRLLPIQEDVRLEKCCLILHLHYMISIYHFDFKVWKLKNPFQSLEEHACVPGPVKKGLLSRFTVKAENSKFYMMPAKLKDKLMLYILVLALHLEEYALQTSHIQTDLSMDPNKLKNFLRQLGCRVSTGKRASDGVHKDNTLATLVTPLVFPVNRQTKSKAKR